MVTISNQYNVKIDFAAAVQYMDDALREDLHIELAPCTPQEFWGAYCTRHEQTFGEPWCLDQPDPVW